MPLELLQESETPRASDVADLAEGLVGWVTFLRLHRAFAKVWWGYGRLQVTTLLERRLYSGKVESPQLICCGGGIFLLVNSGGKRCASVALCPDSGFACEGANVEAALALNLILIRNGVPDGEGL